MQILLEKLTWRLLVWSSRRWAIRYMDQWDKFKFQTPHGTIYVTLSMESESPDSFEEVST